MYDVGDLVTVDSELLRLHLHENTYKQWSSCKFGIVVDVEGYKDGATLLVKVHFHSLGSAYWLHSYEVMHVSPPLVEGK